MKKRDLKILVVLTLIMAIVSYLFEKYHFLDVRKYENKNDTKVWFLEIDFEASQVENQLMTLKPMIEKTLKSEEEIEDLILVTKTDRIYGAFYSDKNSNIGLLKDRINAHISSIKESGIFKKFDYSVAYFSLDKIKKEFGKNAVNTDLEFLSSAIEELDSLNGGTFHIFEKLPVDLSIIPKRGDIQTENEMDLILKRLQTIQGVQLVFASDFDISFVKAEMDVRQLLHLGLKPSNFIETIQKQMQNNIGTNHTIFSRNVPLFEKHIETKSELCELGMQVAKKSSIIHLCDIATISKVGYTIPIYFANESINNLQHFIDSNLHTAKVSGHPETRISILLEPGFLASEIMPQVYDNLYQIFPNKSTSSWEIENKVSSGKSSEFLFINIFIAMLIFLPFFKGDYWNNFSGKAYLMALCSCSLWISVLMMLRIQVSPSGLFLLVCACYITMVCLFLENYVTSLHDQLPLAFDYLLFLCMCILALFLTKAIITTEATGFSVWCENIFPMICPFLCYFFVSDKTLKPKDIKPFSLKLKTKPLGLEFLVIIAVLIPAFFLRKVYKNSPMSNIVMEAGFGNKVNADTIIEFSRQIKNFFDGRKLDYTILSTEKHPIYELTPSDYSLTRKNEYSTTDLISLLNAKVIDRYYLTFDGKNYENYPFFVSIVEEVSKDFFPGKEIDNLKYWLDTIEVPISISGSTYAKGEQHFTPLSALVIPSKKQAIRQVVSSDQGQSAFLSFSVPSVQAAKHLEDLNALFKEFKTKNFDKLNIIQHSSFENKTEILERNAQSTMLFTLFLFFVGAFFFSSLERGALTAITFVTLYSLGLSARVFSHLLSSGNIMGPLMSFPANELWVGILLLTFWAILIKTSDLRRGLNMTLEDSFSPQIAAINKYKHLLVAGSALFFGVVFTFFNTEMFALLFGIVLTIIVSNLLLFPSWMLFFAKIYEIRSMVILKTKIIFTRHGPFLCAALALALCAEQAKGQTDVYIANSQCKELATLVLPIAGRPKGKEAPPHKAIYSEILAQEIPCSWYDNSSLPKLLSLLNENNFAAGQGELLKGVSALVNQEKPRLINSLKEKIVGIPGIKVSKFRIVAGFYEEFFGNISFTILEYRENAEPIISKITYSEEKQTAGISELAGFLRGESIKFYEEILGENERLPVYLERVESLDKHPISENLAGEIDLFLKSRFLYPISFNFFERKTFFLFEPNPEKARYGLFTKIRRDGTKLYASLAANTKNLSSKESAWIEGDISQLPYFEENILATAKKILANTENIADYSVVINFDFMSDFSKISKLIGINFRQNLGNAAITIRIRDGSHNSPQDDDSSFDLLGLGGALGWQFVDFRWLVADAGLSLDAGILSSADGSKVQLKRSFWLSYGPYIQTQLTFWKNASLLARAGIEQPQLFGDTSTRKFSFSSFYINGLLGVGITF